MESPQCKYNVHPNSTPRPRYVTWESPWAWVSGFHLPLQSGPPPRRGMRQWRRAWGRPSPAPPYKLELAPHQSHPPAPPRKACSCGDGDPAGAPPLPIRVICDERERAAARSLPDQWGARGLGLAGIGGGGSRAGQVCPGKGGGPTARLQRTHQSDNARPRSETSQWENRSTTKIYLGTTT